MDKDKKKTYKKTFVRNTQQEKPKTVVINEHEKKTPTETKLNDQKQDEKTKVACPDSKFDKPTVNSALMIARKVDAIENTKPRKVKSVASLPNVQKLAIDEKVSAHT